MRVGFDARWYNDSGVGVYVAGLLRALTERRQDFDLVVYEDPRNPVPGLAVNVVERIQLAARKYSLAEQWELKRHCQKDGLDVFHSPFYVMPLRAPCPVVVTVHDLIPFLFHIDPWPKQAMVKLGYRLAVSRAAQTIAVSQNTASDLRMLKVNPERITVVHNAANVSSFHARLQPSESEHLATKYGLRPPYVVLGSAHNWRTKNLPGALKAVEIAREKSRLNFQTVVYGPEEGLRRAEREIGRSLPNLVTTGYIAPEELGIFFRNAHALIMPSLYEGFGLPVLEAMSCGCAVITSTGGSLPEVAGNGAQIFAPSDINGMAQAVASLLLDPAELCRWRERALVRAADFSWSNAAEQTVSVYHRARRRNEGADQK